MAESSIATTDWTHIANVLSLSHLFSRATWAVVLVAVVTEAMPSTTSATLRATAWRLVKCISLWHLGFLFFLKKVKRSIFSEKN